MKKCNKCIGGIEIREVAELGGPVPDLIQSVYDARTWSAGAVDLDP